MTENRHTHVIARILVLDTVGHAHRTTGHGAFRHKHYRRVLALAETVLDKFSQLVDFCRDLRDDSGLSTGSNRAIESEEAGIASHHFDKEQTFMARSRVADLVDTFHDRVQGCVVTDRGVRSVKVIIDSSGQTDDREIKLIGKNACAGQRSVTTDHDERVDLMAAQIIVGQLTAFRGLELGAACRLEDRATHLDDIGDILSLELHDLIRDQATVTAVDALNLESAEDSRAGDGADGGVHAGSITSRGQNAYALDFCHIILVLGFFVSIITSYRTKLRRISRSCKVFSLRAALFNQPPQALFR